MAEIKIVNEFPVSMAELKEKLNLIKKEKRELSFRANKTLEYLNNFAKMSIKDVEGIKKKLKGLDITRLNEKHIAKIIDVMPSDIDSLRLIFAGETSVKQEDLEKVLECLK